MVKKIALTGVALLTGIVIYAQNKSTTMEAEKEKVLSAHKQIFKAIAEKTALPVSNHLEDAFLFTSANGDMQDKNAFIKDFVVNPAVKLPLFVSSGEKVIVLDSTAILTAVVHINIIRPNETMVRDLWERITGTYIKQENAWKLLAMQATYMPRR